MTLIEEARKRAISGDVRAMREYLCAQNELLDPEKEKWPDPLTSIYVAEWGGPMNDYVERARNATIEECASHLIAVQMDNAEAYAEELRTMKRGDVPVPWWMNDHAPKSTPDVILPWKVWYALAEWMAYTSLQDGHEPDPQHIDEIARMRELRLMNQRFRPANRPGGYEVPEP
jgi:hypothetical protein